MPRYAVTYQATASKTIVVDAEDEADASALRERDGHGRLVSR